MFELLIIAVVIAAVSLIGDYLIRMNKESEVAASLPNPLPSLDNISPLDLEKLWVKVKTDILKTDRIHNAIAYKSSLWQINLIEGVILNRHMELFNSKEIYDRLNMYTSKIVGSDGTFIINRDQDFDAISNEDLMTLAFYSFLGRPWKQVWYIQHDLSLIMSIVDRLIARDHGPAFLLKGIMLKYGLDFTEPPLLDLARKYLQEAKIRNISESDIELTNLSIHLPLLNAYNIHSGGKIEIWK